MQNFSIDADGYLIDHTLWLPEFAQQVAGQTQIQLTADHWEIIYLLRQFYADYALSPNTRLLIKTIKQKLGAEKGNSLYVMHLFTGKPAPLASKMAGLPKPAQCF
jgi:tRNA 2-thiouridine synthesizing protein E